MTKHSGDLISFSLDDNGNVFIHRKEKDEKGDITKTLELPPDAVFLLFDFLLQEDHKKYPFVDKAVSRLEALGFARRNHSL